MAGRRTTKVKNKGIKKKARRARAVPKPKKIRAAVSHDAFLIKKMLQEASSGERRLLIQDLVYSLSDGLRDLAYKSGFNLGVEVYGNSDKTMVSFERILENAGLGKILYYPFESKSIITSYGIKPRGTNLGANAHVFEAGLMSGYLSAHANRSIFVSESRCVYNGSNFCQFIASPMPERRTIKNETTDIDRVARILEESIGSNTGQSATGPYYFLSTKPLLQEPVFSEASKLMYLMGKKLARTGRTTDFNSAVVRIANYLGIGKARVVSGKGKRVVITLTYDHNTSVGNFVDFSTSMLAGFAKETFNKNVHIQRRLNSRRNYHVTMQLLPKVEERRRRV